MVGEEGLFATDWLVLGDERSGDNTTDENLVEANQRA
jgi:hypothetical protein